MKLLKEKWEISIQSTREDGENNVGVPSIVTVPKWPSSLQIGQERMGQVYWGCPGVAFQQKGHIYLGHWGCMCSRGWHWKQQVTVGVVGSSGGSGITMGLLLVPDSITTSSPPGSIMCPVPTPGVPHLPILPLPHWAKVVLWQYLSLGERGGAAPEHWGKGLVCWANWGVGLTAVLVEERESVGEESLSGRGEWGSVGLDRSVPFVGCCCSKLGTAPQRGRGEWCGECWQGDPWGGLPGVSWALYPPAGYVWWCGQWTRQGWRPWQSVQVEMVWWGGQTSVWPGCSCRRGWWPGKRWGCCGRELRQQSACREWDWSRCWQGGFLIGWWGDKRGGWGFCWWGCSGWRAYWDEGEHALWNTLYPLPARVIHAVIRLLPHVLPIWGGILQFPCDKGFSLPRDFKPDARVSVQGIPQHVAQQAEKSKKGENEGNDDMGEDKGIHVFHFLALWWWLYSRKSCGQAILYSVIKGWVFPRFCSGSQVYLAVGYPFHLTRKVQWLGLPLCLRTASTSYYSALSIRSSGSRRKLGPCSGVSL